MSNEQSKVVTKVIDFRHKAPDQAIHELMQAAKDGFAVTKVVTRFNHTHVYLEANAKQVSETSSKQVSTKQVSTSEAVGETSTKQVSTSDVVVEPAKEAFVEKEEAKSEPVKTTAKKTATKAAPKKEEPKASE